MMVGFQRADVAGGGKTMMVKNYAQKAALLVEEL
jgi:hypothetical protein